MDNVQKDIRLKRGAGILMPIFSLPSKYGIGNIGKASYDFVKHLNKIGMSYWQILPIHPVTEENSPYFVTSVFAGNELYIDFELLIDEGYISKNEWDKLSYSDDGTFVNYSMVKESHFSILNKVFEKFCVNTPNDFDQFCQDNSYWLDNYAIFKAICEVTNINEISKWPKKLIIKEKSAINNFTKVYANLIDKHKVFQYLFFKQWNKLKEYANRKGILIIGDMPFCAGFNSADVWSNPELYNIDENFNILSFAGVPKQANNTQFQNWGMPTYKWQEHKKDNYLWWTKRAEMISKLYDIVRIDHFCGFNKYFDIKINDGKTKDCKWKLGPGEDLISKLVKQFPSGTYFAEYTGNEPEAVLKLMNNYNIPGMKTLLDNITHTNCTLNEITFEKSWIIYLGSHDNTTSVGWWNCASKSEIEYIKSFHLVNNESEFTQKLLIFTLATPCTICILRIQDLLCLDDSASWNHPGIICEQNWTWRATKKQLDKVESANIRSLLAHYDR